MSLPPDTASVPTEGAAVVPTNHRSVRIFGVTLPRWAMYALGVFVVFALILGLGAFTYLRFVQPKLIEQAVAQSSQFQEGQKHFSDPPTSKNEIFKGGDLGLLTVNVYRDGCVEVLRKSPNQEKVIPHWIPAKAAEVEAAPGDVGGGGGTNVSLLQDPLDNHGLSRGKIMLASFNGTAPAPAAPSEGPATSGCNGRCIHPHQGPFQSWNGEQRGCWIAVWRKWPDGCEHYQWFNTCNGYWDNDKNGQAQVYWKCCVH